MELSGVVESYMTQYGAYDNSTRGAVGLDGLKHVHRRILVSLWEIGRDKYIKAAQLVGHCMGHYHPHSDQAIYGAIIKMVHNGLIIGQGNFGSKTGLDPSLTKEASMRYPEVKWNPDLNIDMKYIKFANMTTTEIGVGEEPTIIPACLPFCLVCRKRAQLLAQGIGVGVKSNYLTYKPKDLIEHCLLESKKTIRPYLGPDINIKVDGDGVVIASPKLKVEEKRVICYSNIGNIKKVADQLADNVSVIDLSTPDHSEIIFEIKPYKRINSKDIVKKIQRYTTIKLREQLFISGPDGILYSTNLCLWISSLFRYRVECATRYYQDKADSIRRKISALQLIALIRPYISKIKEVTVDDFIKSLRSTKSIAKKISGFTNEEISDIISRYKISTLITCDTDTSLLESKLNDIEKLLSNIENVVLDELRER